MEGRGPGGCRGKAEGAGPGEGGGGGQGRGFVGTISKKERKKKLPWTSPAGGVIYCQRSNTEAASSAGYDYGGTAGFIADGLEHAQAFDDHLLVLRLSLLSLVGRL